MTADALARKGEVSAAEPAVEEFILASGCCVSTHSTLQTSTQLTSVFAGVTTLKPERHLLREIHTP